MAGVVGWLTTAASDLKVNLEQWIRRMSEFNPAATRFIDQPAAVAMKRGGVLHGARAGRFVCAYDPNCHLYFSHLR